MLDWAGSSLLVDVGNSRTKWGLGKNGRIEPGEPFATETFNNNAETLACCWQSALPPVQVLVANVAGAEIARCLEAWTQRHWGLAPQFIRSEAAGFGVRNAYLSPGKLGVDRWVALVGARHTRQGPICLADCGTAITVDAMDAEGKHLGGVIAPGLMLMRRSLVAGTSALPFAGVAFHDRLARETSAAIVSGTLQAAAGLLERCFREAAIRLGSETRLLLTGGDAQAIAPLLEIPFEVRSELVLEGLLMIATHRRPE